MLHIEKAGSFKKLLDVALTRSLNDVFEEGVELLQHGDDGRNAGLAIREKPNPLPNFHLNCYDPCRTGLNSQDCYPEQSEPYRRHNTVLRSADRSWDSRLREVDD